MVKNIMHKQLKTPPPLREQSARRKSVRRPKDINFSEALDKLKRGFKVKRSQWPDMHLEIRNDERGNKEIFNASSKSSQGIRHTFDQNEILASDWMVL